MKIYFFLRVDHAPSDSYLDLRISKSQVVGVPYARIYKESSTVPTFSPMVDGGGYWQVTLHNIIDYGNYRIEFKDDNHSNTLIGKAKVTSAAVTSCSNLGTGDINLSSTGIKVLGNIAESISIDGGATFKSVDSAGSAFWNNSEISNLGLTTSINQIVCRRTGCPDSTLAYNIYLDDYQPLTINPIVSNVTVNGGSDGSITLDIVGGSGNFTYSWSDGPTTQNRSGLLAGDYTVTVTDVVTGVIEVLPLNVAEPAIAPPVKGTFLVVPQLNSLSFVVDQAIDECTNPQNLDNRLFKDQYFEGVVQNEQDYFQPVNKCDQLVTQFNSDFSTFEILLRKYCDGTVVKNFPYLLQQQNIGATDDFALQIQNHTVYGQSRVYFGVGVPPIPLTVGESFQILNNVNFNGTYSIVSIENDSLKGYQYIVITKTFTGPATQTATGRFVTTTANFNVFESQHDFTDVPDGKYYITIRAYDQDLISPDITATSEPIDLAVSHPNTNLIRYKNIDNAFDFTWATGYLGLLRVPSHFGNKRQPKGDRTTSRDADYSLVKVSARKSRIVTFIAWDQPPYMHEKLSCVFDCDSITINNQTCQTSDDYDPDDADDYTMLSKGTIKVEVKWFSDYNSDDIGSVQDGGFLKTESGFLKR